MEELEALKQIMGVNNDEILALTSKLEETKSDDDIQLKLTAVKDALAGREQELETLYSKLDAAHAQLEYQDQKIKLLDEKEEKTLDAKDEEPHSLKLSTKEMKSLDVHLVVERENLENKIRIQSEEIILLLQKQD